MDGLEAGMSGPANPDDGRGACSKTSLCLVAACLVILPPALPAAGQWVEEAGQGWISLSIYHQDTRNQFDLSGNSREIFAEGHAITTSSFLTIAGGLFDGVDAWAQFSFSHLQFDDLAGERTSTGLGDSRFHVRVAPLHYLGSGFPFAIRAGVKVPFGDFDVDAEIIPLGDGQVDWEIMGEIGHSFYPRSFYVMGWGGYRWRELNTESRKDFGNELFFLIAGGGELGPIGYKVQLEGWDGAPSTIEGIPVFSAQRDLLQLTPSLFLPGGPGQIEVGARFILSGRNLPDGTALVIGYFSRWGF